MERALTKDGRQAKFEKAGENVNARGRALFAGGLVFGRNEAAVLGLGILGFLVGRVMLGGPGGYININLASAAFLSVFLCTGVQFYVILAFVAAGLFTAKLGVVLFIKYAVVLCAMAIANAGMTRFMPEPPALAAAAAAAASAFLGALVIMVTNVSGDNYIALIALTMLEPALAFMMSIVLREGGQALFSGRARGAPGIEEAIGAALILCLAVAGASGITPGGAPLWLFLSCLFLLFAAYKGGAAFAAAAGLLIGLTLYFFAASDNIPNWNITFPMALAASGMFAGVWRGKGKAAVVLAFAACMAVLAVVMTPGILSPGVFFAVLTASLAFVFAPDGAVPANLFGFAFNGFSPALAEEAYRDSERAGQAVRDRLLSLSASFDKLAESFDGISNGAPAGAPEKKRAPGQAETTGLINDIGKAACGECARRSACWEEKIYETLQAVYDMLGTCEKKGALEKADIPADFSGRCIAPGAFAQTVLRLYELHSVNAAWQNRLSESRRLAAQQLSGVAEIVRTLAGEIQIAPVFNKDIEDAVMKEMKRAGLPVQSVLAREPASGGLELTVLHTAGGRALCSPYNQVGKRRCREIILAAGRATGRRLKPVGGQCVFEGDGCRLKLGEELRFKLQSGAAYMPKSGAGVSGDSCAFFEPGDGHMYIAVSDGMGAGQRAHDQSAAAVSLFEDFIRAGFERQLAVRIINSALVLKSAEEAALTLDVCSFDMRTGAAEFIKIGAAASYILRDGFVQALRSTSLPMGILNMLDSQVYSKQLKRGDYIVMVTDGANEAGGGLADMADKAWITRALADYKGSSPQELADYILEEAQKRYDGAVRDDITVIASKVWER